MTIKRKKKQKKKQKLECLSSELSVKVYFKIRTPNLRDSFELTKLAVLYSRTILLVKSKKSEVNVE